MDLVTSRPLTRWSASLTLIVFIGSGQVACGYWRTARIASEPDAFSAGDTLRLRRGNERRTVRVVRVQYPRVEAVEDAPKGPMAVVCDLTTFDEVEVYSYPRGVALTSLGVAGLAAAIGALGAGIFFVVCNGCLRN